MADEIAQFELTNARSLRVLETNILHATDVIYWLDGASADTVTNMSRINHSLELIIVNKPTALKLLNTPGKTAFWFTPTESMFAGVTNDSQRQRPAVSDFVLNGFVKDNTGRFNSAAFSVSLGSGNGSSVVLYPTISSVRLSPCGGIQGHVAFVNNSEPLKWGLLTLIVSVSLGETIRFKGQTDAKGDFILSLNRLPQLPLHMTGFSAFLHIDGLVSSDPREPLNVEDFLAMKIESGILQSNFENTFPLTIRPGELKRINSFNKSFVAVQFA